MRFLSADYLFTIKSEPIKDGVIVLGDDGTILNILIDKSNLPKDAELEIHRGIICPGFVNAHCHLELSFLKDKIQEGKGLATFLKDLIPERKVSDEIILNAAIEADAEMVANGIVVVADICNSDISIPVKTNSRMYYHSFIEIFDLQAERAFDSFGEGKKLQDKFVMSGLSSSIVPHAPYSVTSKLLKLINDFAYENNSILSIHNQEAAGENEMFIDGTGTFLHELNKISGAFTNWKPTGFRSLPSVFVHLPKCNKIQFVHNTYSEKEDLQWAHLYNLFVWWCLCPKANLFIENRIPNIELFKQEASKVTIGTDSYASNTSLSILEELKCIQTNSSSTTLSMLLSWATLNGAEFLGLQKQYGSLEIGKKPGINLIADVNLDTLELEASSFVIPLI